MAVEQKTEALNPLHGVYLVVVGHGSRTRGHASEATRALGAALRQSGAFAGVAVAFIKQRPSLQDALEALPRGARVMVLPHFAADGLFVRDIIPRETAGHRSRFRSLVVLPPLGLHPGLADHVAALIAGIGKPDVVVVGHGSPRFGQAAGAALGLVEGLRAAAVPVLGLHVLFLEQEPRLERWTDLGLGTDVLVVTMLAGKGIHGGEEVPAAFGLPRHVGNGGPFSVGGRRLWLAAPLADAALTARLAVQDALKQADLGRVRHTLDQHQTAISDGA